MAHYNVEFAGNKGSKPSEPEPFSDESTAPSAVYTPNDGGLPSADALRQQNKISTPSSSLEVEQPLSRVKIFCFHEGDSYRERECLSIGSILNTPSIRCFMHLRRRDVHERSGR